MLCASVASFFAAGEGFAQSRSDMRFAQWLARMRDRAIIRYPDIEYSREPTADSARRRLDVYTSEALSGAPVVIFFHGGGWQAGDKIAVGQKPIALVPAGFVVVSANYRFRPEVSVVEMAADAARAVVWVMANVRAYGGDPERIFLMGHSAGAHLASLIGTNAAYLGTFGVSLDRLSGVVSLDTGPYDVARKVEEVGARDTSYAIMIRTVFGADPDVHEAVSPMHHVIPESGIPPFLVVASDQRGDLPYQAAPFVDRLRRAGVQATLHVATGRTHESLNSELGSPGDETTGLVLEFLRSNAQR